MITLIGCSKYPSSYLKLKVLGDNVQFEGTVNGATWINGEGGSSADLGSWDMERAKDIKSVNVKARSLLSLNLTYTKNIRNLIVRKVEGTSKDNQKYTSVKVEDYKMQVPMEKGIHIYSVQAIWDRKHSVGYVFKINVD
jgi:hypothetical protein